MDSTTVGIICTAVAGAAGWFGKQGMDWYLKYKNDRREDIKLQESREDVLDEKEDKTLRYIIGIQQGEITSLRSEVKESQANYRTELETLRSNHRAELTSLHDAHNDCEKRYTALEVELRIRLQAMDSRMGKVEKQEEIAKEVAKTRHDIKDDLNTVSMKVTEVQQTLKAHDSGVFKPGDIIKE